MWIQDIALYIEGHIACATVLIAGDFEGIAGARVTAEWSGLVGGAVSGVTDSKGEITFFSIKTKKSGTFIFTVKDVSAPGYAYNAMQNFETSDSVDYP